MIRRTSSAVVRWLLLLPLCAVVASALMPPMADYSYEDGGAQVSLKVPQDWTITKVPRGLRAQKDPAHELFGTALIGWYEYDQAPTPDLFLAGALEGWSKQFANWKVVAREAPEDRPRVRLATVSFTVHGFPCRGYVMAVIGQETGTIGFAYAETVIAKQMRLDELVQLFVAGSYSAYPVRGDENPEAQQAIQQAIDKLYGGANDDFAQVFQDLANDNQLDAGLLDLCGMYQPALRDLMSFLAGYLPERPQERVKELQVYCLPTHEFNAFALGRNNVGPGFLAFHIGLTQPFALLAQHYVSLRNQNLDVATCSQQLTSYSGQLAAAVLAGEELPQPGPVDFSQDINVQRFEKVFLGMIGLVMSHELAHYYLRHAESGQDPNNPHSIQQREVAADAAALSHLQSAADKSPNVWEGGAIHAFGFLATVDTVAQQMKGEAPEPEWTRSHPAGQTRLDMASATLGEDNFQVRNDPWNSSALLETDGGVQVVGSLPGTGGTGGGPQTQEAFTHPVSGVEMSIPAGWVGAYDGESGVVKLTRVSGANFPLALYSCGGEYSGTKAVTDEIFAEMRKGAQSFEVQDDSDLDTGSDQLQIHLAIAQGQFEAGVLSMVALGIKSPGMWHGMMLLTTPEQLEADVADFQKLVESMQFKG